MILLQKIIWIPLLILCLFVLLQGCAVKKHPGPPTMALDGFPGSFRAGQIIDLEAGEAISYEQFIRKIAASDIIFVGETHDSPEDHLIQTQILQSVVACCGPVNVAMEFFEKPKQALLDSYVNGDMTEEAFLTEVDWKRGWGFDYHLYRPLMQSVKGSGGRILAINVPRPVVRKVARGGLKSLDAEDREKVARDVDLSQEAHKSYVREAFQGHGHPGLKSFDFFYEAQCVWDDTMAENIAEFYRTDPKKMVVFTGKGHILYKFGIPDRTSRRIPVSTAVVVPYAMRPGETLKKGIADYVWLTKD